jgi:hypothetical protein
MILKQRFSTLHGIQRRVAFENAHNRYWSYIAVRFLNNKEDNEPFDDKKYNSSHYHWQLKKISKRLKASQHR